MDAKSQASSATPVTKQDGDSSEESDYSEDEKDGLESIYSTVPEDLGFTVVGMNFPKNDLRIIRRLRLDLDTFMSLSEKELLDIGIKDSVNIKRQITRNVQGKQSFNRPKKSLRLTGDEMKVLGSSLSGQISELNLFLANINAGVNLKKPTNYRVCQGSSSLEIFQAACMTLLRQAKETRKCVESLSKEMGFTLPNEYSKDIKKIEKARMKKNVKICVLVAGSSLLIYFAVKKLVLPSVSHRL